MIRLVDADYESLLHICENLREADREEVFATNWGNDPARLAAITFSLGSFQWVAELDGKPVASIGAHPVWPGVWQVWAFGTDDFMKVVRTLTKHVKRFMWPALENTDAHRIQCFAMQSHEQACRWLEFLGAHPETVMENFGRDKQPFVLYVWTRDRTKGVGKKRD